MMDQEISKVIDSLPTLTKDDVDVHGFCPICFVDFQTISDGNDNELTKMSACDHVFCREEYISHPFHPSFNSRYQVWYSGYATGYSESLIVPHRPDSSIARQLSHLPKSLLFQHRLLL